MNRRSFLKGGIASLLLGALSSNKVLATVINTIPNDSLDVLLYLIQTKNGDWKIKGTKWTAIKKARLSQFEYNLETFKPLEIVDYKLVGNIKKKYAKQYNCVGRAQNVNHLAAYKSGLKAKESGQFAEAQKKSIGASHRIYKEWWKEHGKKIGEQNKVNGHLTKLHELYGKDLGKKWGKMGAKKVLDNKLGIHSATKEQRIKWGSIGGKVGGKATASKYDMKSFSKLGNEANIKKYGEEIWAHNLITFETKQFDSKGSACRYCNTQNHILNKIINGKQKSLKSGWVFYKK